jgi:hypothetical protein
LGALLICPKFVYTVRTNPQENKLSYLDQLAIGLPWCIAGGYAACPQLAGDMDVWVLAGPQPYGSGLEQLAERICKANPVIVPHAPMETDPPYILDHGCTIFKVGAQYPPSGVTVHLMATECSTIQELLDCFDISTHQCALNKDGEFIKGRNWTPITESPVELFSTPNTAARLAKIRARYQQFKTVAA